MEKSANKFGNNYPVENEEYTQKYNVGYDKNYHSEYGSNYNNNYDNYESYDNNFNSEYTEDSQLYTTDTYEYADHYSPTQYSAPTTETAAPAPALTNPWKKAGLIALIVLVFIGLFFSSMWITTLILDKNHKVDDYEDDVPVYSDDEADKDFGIIVESDDETPEVKIIEKEEEEPAEKPAPSTSSSKKPAASADTKKDSEADKSKDTQKKDSDESDTAGEETSKQPADTGEDVPPVSDAPADTPSQSTESSKPPAPSAPTAPQESTSTVPTIPSLVVTTE